MITGISSLLALVIGSSSILLGAVFVLKNDVVTGFMENIGSQKRLSMAFEASKLVAGSIIVYLNNKWVIGYEGLITLIGWYLVVDSAADLVVPESIKDKLGDNLEENEEEADTVNQGLGAFLILVGLYLLYSVI